MLYTFYVSAAANTPQTSPTTYKLKIGAGVLTKAAVVIPTGHHALAHLIVKDGATPFIPEAGGVGILGDGNIVYWEGWKEIKEDPYTLNADVWNEDDTYEHGFIVYLTVLPRHLAYPFGRLIELLERLLGLFKVFKV